MSYTNPNPAAAPAAPQPDNPAGESAQAVGGIGTAAVPPADAATTPQPASADQPAPPAPGEQSAAAVENDEPGFYCPGCGKRVEYRQQCTGRPEAPHQPIEVVDAAELDGDPENHTAAPPSE